MLLSCSNIVFSFFLFPPLSSWIERTCLYGLTLLFRGTPFTRRFSWLSCSFFEFMCHLTVAVIESISVLKLLPGIERGTVEKSNERNLSVTAMVFHLR